MKHLAIAPANIADILEIVDVRRQTWLTTYPNEQYDISYRDIKEALANQPLEKEIQRLSDSLSNPNIGTWVVKDSDKVVGFIRVSKGAANHRIDAAYILSAYQHQGLGGKLMDQALKWLGNKKEIILEVASYNQPAIDFYKKFNFIEDGPAHNPVGDLPSGKTIPEIKMTRRSVS